MKTNKLFLILALLISSVSLSANSALAQPSTVPVILNTRVASYDNWATGTTWWVTLHNNTTNEDFYLETNYYNLHEDGYHLGSIPPGDYTVKVAYYNTMFSYTNFDWYINDQSGYRGMYAQNEYELTSNVTVTNDPYYTNNYGLNIFLYTN